MGRYYGQFDPPTDQLLHERYFRGVEGGVMVEAGAFDGLLECNSKFFEDDLGWTCYNVEPLPHVFERLQRNRPRSHNIRCALSDVDGEATITVYNHAHFGLYNTNGSLGHVPTHRALLRTWTGGPPVQYRVPTRTFASLVREHDIARVDCLVLDVEGHELEVLEGMRESPVLPRVMMVEYPHIGLEALRDRVDRLFEGARAYRFDGTEHNNAYFVASSAERNAR